MSGSAGSSACASNEAPAQKRCAECGRRVALAFLESTACKGCTNVFCRLHKDIHRDTCPKMRELDDAARRKAAQALLQSATTPSQNLVRL